MSQETLESAGAAAKLAAEISTQESVLKNLQRGYEDYIVSGSESTDEALKLADTIQDLSNELNENRGALEAAHETPEHLVCRLLLEQKKIIKRVPSLWDCTQEEQGIRGTLNCSSHG